MNTITKYKSLLLLSVAAYAACSAPATESLSAGDPLAYSIVYSVTPNPALGTIDVTMQVDQGRDLLREVRFRGGPRISDIRASGDIRTDAGETRWRPPASGGTLRWTVAVVHRRNGGGHDAWLGDAWGLLRAEDIVPRAATRTLRGAHSETTLRFHLPDDWTVITAYSGANNEFQIKKRQRRFDQPDGWIAMGHLGVRRETIAGVRVAVAGPVGHALRRMDILALLSWTLPELSRLLPELPSRLTIVSAGDPMWRGGLSAPQSLYIHAERPLISENATSTLLHEVMHTTLRIKTKAGYDWIIEGLAEYYSLELLRRSGTISQKRYATALGDQIEWAKSANNLCQQSSTGAATALAVTVMAALDEEIRSKTNGAASLDDLLRELQQHEQPVDLLTMTRIATELINNKSDVLAIKDLPGCRTIRAGQSGNSIEE